MGPYQVVEITTQGAIKIATLDGVVMEGYINGSKLKKFYGPLTLQTLQIIHNNQKRKKGGKTDTTASSLGSKRQRGEGKVQKGDLVQGHPRG